MILRGLGVVLGKKEKEGHKMQKTLNDESPPATLQLRICPDVKSNLWVDLELEDLSSISVSDTQSLVLQA